MLRYDNILKQARSLSESPTTIYEHKKVIRRQMQAIEKAIENASDSLKAIEANAAALRKFLYTEGKNDAPPVFDTTDSKPKKAFHRCEAIIREVEILRATLAMVEERAKRLQALREVIE